MEIEKEKKGNNIFFVNIKNKDELYEAYMPFVLNGALFVRTEQVCQLGDDVFLLVKLLDEPEQFTVAGKVVWLTPSCAQEGKATGIGVQFVSEESNVLQKKIETFLAGSLQSARQTETL